MSGWIQRLFTRRWQHPDPRIRAQAVARLDPTREEDRHALEQLIDDDDAEIRLKALAKLHDPAWLLERLSAGSDTPQLRLRLIDLLVGRETGITLHERLSLVERLDDTQLLSDIAMQGDNQQLRLAALARLSDEEALVQQACENGIAAVRHAAAERVKSEEGLTRLTRHARRDKNVARLARERLNQLRADAAQVVQAHAERERILQALEQHAQHTWEPLYAGRYRHLQREWEALKNLPSAEQERRYQDACLLCRKTITDHEAQRHVHEVADRQREDAAQTRQSLVEALEESLQGLRLGERLGTQDIDSLRAQKRLLASRWQALSDTHPPEDALRQRYDHALDEYERIGQAWERLGQKAEALQQALAEDDRACLAALHEECAWPDWLPPTPLLERVRNLLHEDSAATSLSHDQRLQAFERDLQELERLLQQGAFKGASRLHQSLRQRAEHLPESRLHPLLGTLKRLGAQLAELRDWRGFVAGPKRNQLCQAITELAADDSIVDAELDRRHRQLVKEWKELGDAAADRELSTRFRAASDRIHERLAPWRETQNRQRERNLEARQALCEQLEALLEQPDPAADPDALRDIRDRAREQWRRHSPVPRDQAEAIGRRFGRIRHGLQALIDRRAQEIASAKRDLIEQARELQTSFHSVGQRAEQIKALQRRWRGLGRAPKGEEQALWREFRTICDAIFASREAERDNRAQRAKAQLDAMQALIDRIDAWQPDTSQDTTLLDQAIAEAESLEPLPQGRRSEGMRRRWSGILRARRGRLERLAVQEEVERWKTLQPLLNAHLTADEAVLMGQEAVDVPSDDTLSGDMIQAHLHRNAARRHPPTDTEVEETLTRLRVHLALLAGARVSPQDDPLRLAIQVERLNNGLGRELTLAEELHGVLREIFATGPISKSLWMREASELDTLLTKLLRLPPS
ncbi:hypothetical protein GCM10007160_39590 [Litchfieldella qijiaojingensis]|uniref:DUF349 domain-containing protein n=1 Tax=Litchfieldella qijiaojingensis TaxID=980347 RepID=A0ABQ2ZA55_9GAMM|nr:DUF349 domain-containing protein [Halomonas qijiaojingensis]GGY08244.1 hypothetical protein GCM10007160_39590 [Halomonas qijiaojingensis]